MQRSYSLITRARGGLTPTSATPSFKKRGGGPVKIKTAKPEGKREGVGHLLQNTSRGGKTVCRGMMGYAAEDKKRSLCARGGADSAPNYPRHSWRRGRGSVTSYRKRISLKRRGKENRAGAFTLAHQRVQHRQ